MESVGSPVSSTAGDWVEARDTLRQWREESSRKSSKIVELGSFLLRHRKQDLGNEVWCIYEQTCIAALDCGDLVRAKECVESLKKKFPNSVRVSRLKGLCLEAKEKYLEVDSQYSDMLKENPSSSVWKRKVAILKAQGKIVDAIKELNQFLQVFMSDSEAWLELGDMYIQINEYERAAFCLEELILSNPHHYLYHLKYAEICYTLGSSERMELAKKHYATSVKLNPASLRALYGFYLICQWFGPKSKQSDSKSKNHQCMDWAKAQIIQCYQFDDHKLRIVEKMLDK